MNQHPLSPGEVAVLRAMVENGDQRWFTPAQVLGLVTDNADGLTYTIVGVDRWLGQLLGVDLLIRHWDGFIPNFAVTTRGHMRLRDHDQERLPV